MAQWDFTLSDGSVLHVHPGTGHWAQVLNVDLGEIVRSVYIFEADQAFPTGETKEKVLLRSDLQRLRRAVSKAAKKHKEPRLVQWV